MHLPSSKTASGPAICFNPAFRKSVLAVICSLVAASSHAQPISTARGLSYTPEQMAERLMQIAEGPIPAMKAIEKEFGIVFTAGDGWHKNSYWATAPFPFRNSSEYRARNISFDDYVAKTYSFQFDVTYEKTREPTSFCIPTSKVFTMLRQWQRHASVDNGHFPVDVTYTKETGGFFRKVSVYPPRTEGCVDLFSVTYLDVTDKEKR